MIQLTRGYINISWCFSICILLSFSIYSCSSTKHKVHALNNKKYVIDLTESQIVILQDAITCGPCTEEIIDFYLNKEEIKRISVVLLICKSRYCKEKAFIEYSHLVSNKVSFYYQFSSKSDIYSPSKKSTLFNQYMDEKSPVVLVIDGNGGIERMNYLEFKNSINKGEL